MSIAKMISAYLFGGVLGYAVQGISVDLDKILFFTLLLFLFLIGVELMLEPLNVRAQMKALVHGVVLVLATMLGTAVGVGLGGWFFPEVSFVEALLVGSGFAYASATSVIIGSTLGSYLGTLGFLTNIFRELLVLIFASQIGRFGTHSLIASSGSTSMDSALPVILRQGGSRFAVQSVSHGFILTALVPLFVSGFVTLLS